MSDRPMPASFEDLTARARIRDAALEHFARDGFAKTTIRNIARTAGVSPGLLRHHFGSKEALREACDAHVLRVLRRGAEQASGRQPVNPIPVGRMIMPFQRYVARALVDGSAAAAAFFDQIVTVTEQWLADADQRRAEPPIGDLRARAALIIAMRMGIPLLHEHVSRALGVDIFGAEGDRRLVLALLDLHSHPLISPEVAAAAQAMLDKPQDQPSR